MRFVSIILVSLLALAGCASPSGSPELAREVVLKHVGEGVGTVGPFNRKDKKELGKLSAADRATALTLLDRGALGFLICRPDNGTSSKAADAVLADLINVDRIVFVQRGEIVGDFPAEK